MEKGRNTLYVEGKPLVAKIDCDHLDISPSLVQRYFGGSRYVARAESKQRIADGIERAKQLAQPLGMITLHKIDNLTPDGLLILGGGVAIPCPSASLTDDMVGVAIGLVTLGAGLEQYCRELSADGELFDSVLLDAAGTALLEDCDAFCCEQLADKVLRQGLFLGERYAPGIGDYHMTAQRDLFSLMEPGRIGVHLNEACIMSPVKSLTHLTFLTSTETTSKRAYKCLHCSRKQCQFRASNRQT